MSKPFVDHMDIVVLTELLTRYGVSAIAPNLNRLRNRSLKVETSSRTATNGKIEPQGYLLRGEPPNSAYAEFYFGFPALAT